MPYVAQSPEDDVGRVVGDGNCVAYVKKAAGCPVTSLWRSGAKARANALARGTAIATFQNGKYGNYTDGRSHAAIYLSEDKTGLKVMDQWKGHAVSERVIRFKGGVGDARNDGDAFTTIEPQSLFTRIKLRMLALVGRKPD
jgi:hypothetical protein